MFKRLLGTQWGVVVVVVVRFLFFLFFFFHPFKKYGVCPGDFRTSQTFWGVI